MLQGPAQADEPKSFGERIFWIFVLKIPEVLLAVLIAVLVIFLTASVIGRYVFDIGLSWSDEASRLLFIWVVFLGFAVGVRHRAHIGVDWAVDRLPKTQRWIVEVIQDAAILFFSVLFTWQGWITVRYSFLQRLPGLDISIAWLYFAVLVAGVLMTIYALFNLWDTLRGKRARIDAIGTDAVRLSE
jgi:TRAP-type C4-dicarboxylate transport system permease small subunit